jgi:hypothetical protein
LRVFSCDSCDQLVFFENADCLRCLHPLGFVLERRDLIALERLDDGSFAEYRDPSSRWHRCRTAATTACNWLVRDRGGLCECCRLTRTRPADRDREGMAELVRAEKAKRRLIFQLAELGLPVRRRDPVTGRGLAFDLLSSVTTKVVTGHDNGVITLDLAEADDEHREHLRVKLDEPYRTLLGHFRHEIGHYYWPLLVQAPEVLAACRSLFGDERADYRLAVKGHYNSPPEAGWEGRYISRYATMHPYEDWAETFAHYLHIVDVMQVADSFSIGQSSPAGRERFALDPRLDPTRPDRNASFEEVVADWLELTYALNQINRSMGYEDLYPFVLARPVIEKLTFVDELVHTASMAGRAGGA